MTNLVSIAQLVVALAVIYVWVFRFDNIVLEFRQYGLSDQTRTLVGATKIALATLLIAGIWYPALVLVPALLMGALMLAAQYFHHKVRNPLVKRAPSFILLVLCAFIAYAALHPAA
ncbi:hypothetical protein GCM10027422_13450 [Hymenobacter arcticus]